MRKFKSRLSAIMTTPIGAVILICFMCGLYALSDYIQYSILS